jgi:hypothetical protein
MAIYKVSKFDTRGQYDRSKIGYLQGNLDSQPAIIVSYTELMTGTTAKDFLVFGDAVRDRAERDSQPVATIAADLGASPAVAAKATWLAGAYPQATRAELGSEVLADLRPSHLEAAALAPEGTRAQLLLRAAREKLGVRALKRLAADHANGGHRDTVAISGGDDLASSARAVSAYLEFNDDQLSRLLAGPRGSAIRTLAQAGAALATRIGDNRLTPTSQSNGGTACH